MSKSAILDLAAIVLGILLTPGALSHTEVEPSLTDLVAARGAETSMYASILVSAEISRLVGVVEKDGGDAVGGEASLRLHEGVSG